MTLFGKADSQLFTEEPSLPDCWRVRDSFRQKFINNVDKVGKVGPIKAALINRPGEPPRAGSDKTVDNKLQKVDKLTEKLIKPALNPPAIINNWDRAVKTRYLRYFLIYSPGMCTLRPPRRVKPLKSTKS